MQKPSENLLINIYELRSNRRRLVILTCLALTGLVLPFSDTIYLPALTDIEHKLQTSTIFVDYTISAYIIAAGIGGLFWGPLSDRFGRKKILLLALVLFVATTAICVFARSILMLLIFRSLQGFAISSSLLVGQCAIVDMYPKEKLGFALGLFLVPVLAGPIAGPFIGGILCDKFGWPSTFICLAILGSIATILILAFVPETHHYFVLRRIAERECNEKQAITPHEIDRLFKPQFIPPWRPFIFLRDLTLIPHIVLCNTNFAILFLNYTLLSNRLSQTPYSLSPFAIGLCYISTGFTSLIGSLFGGWTSDIASEYIHHAMEGRLLINTIVSLACPIGLLIFGWAFHFECHLSGPLIGISLYSFGEAFLFTGASAFASVKIPTMTGAILALINTLNFVSGGLTIIVAIPLVQQLRFGWSYSILATISFISLLSSLTSTLIQLYRSSKSRSIPLQSINDDLPKSPSHIQRF